MEKSKMDLIPLGEEDLAYVNPGDTIFYRNSLGKDIPAIVKAVYLLSSRVWVEMGGDCEERLAKAGKGMLLAPPNIYMDRNAIPAERLELIKSLKLE